MYIQLHNPFYPPTMEDCQEKYNLTIFVVRAALSQPTGGVKRIVIVVEMER